MPLIGTQKISVLTFLCSGGGDTCHQLWLVFCDIADEQKVDVWPLMGDPVAEESEVVTWHAVANAVTTVNMVTSTPERGTRLSHTLEPSDVNHLLAGISQYWAVWHTHTSPFHSLDCSQSWTIHEHLAKFKLITLTPHPHTHTHPPNTPTHPPTHTHTHTTHTFNTAVVRCISKAFRHWCVIHGGAHKSAHVAITPAHM